ncbi:hypothetical protein CEXT_477771 [Caerostris extrusa]|uniref:Uncharacterized protein n=1 Tax=Caerostris extrusa TaxID=172846 RepID=A0AAV4WVS7_CAEEX|nr:hypothetical protein CEXT_477771 [Caerostris extrusa]
MSETTVLGSLGPEEEGRGGDICHGGAKCPLRSDSILVSLSDGQWERKDHRGAVTPRINNYYDGWTVNDAATLSVFPPLFENHLQKERMINSKNPVHPIPQFQMLLILPVSAEITVCCRPLSPPPPSP